MASESTEEESALDETAEMFEQGMELGKVWAQKAATGLAAWAEKSPEQVVLVGVGLGFVLGKIFFAGGRKRA